MEFRLRAATREDCKDIRRMMSELAGHEKLGKDHVKITEKDLEQDGFCENPFFRGVIAEVPEQHKSKDGHTKIGYSIYFYSYSSWKGRSVFMVDLYVMPEFRGTGIGKALMKKVAHLALDAGCKQMNFTVSNQNKSALDFYQSQGSLDLTTYLGYHYMCTYGDAFQQLAK